MKKLILIIALVLMASPAFAEPTPKARSLTWSQAPTPGLDGFKIYFAPETESPRVYSSARVFDLKNPAAQQTFILDVSPGISGTWCFKVTAYTATGESDFSNEACGFLGMIGPTDLKLE